jgi:hypothetical protein
MAFHKPGGVWAKLEIVSLERLTDSLEATLLVPLEALFVFDPNVRRGCSRVQLGKGCGGGNDVVDRGAHEAHRTVGRKEAQ